MRRATAYVMSLVVLAASLWTPTIAYAQLIPGSPFGAGGGAGSAPPFSDASALVMGSADPSKLLIFEVDGFTASTTRTITVPNVTDTMAVLGAQTFSGAQTFNGQVTMGSTIPLALTATATGGSFILPTQQTPDTPMITTGTTSNAWLFGEFADRLFDRAIPLMINPALHFVPAAQNTTERTSIAHFGLHGRAVKALTESAATSVVRIPVAASAGAGGTITFTAFAADATDQQTLAGTIQYSAVNKASAETCATPTAQGTPLNSVSVGTLTCTFACDTTPADAVDIQFNCVSSLTQTTLDLYYRVNALGASEPLPQ